MGEGLTRDRVPEEIGRGGDVERELYRVVFLVREEKEGKEKMGMGCARREKGKGRYWT